MRAELGWHHLNVVSVGAEQNAQVVLLLLSCRAHRVRMEASRNAVVSAGELLRHTPPCVTLLPFVGLGFCLLAEVGVGLQLANHESTHDKGYD